MADLEKIKAIPIKDVLSGMGIEPVKRSGKELYYNRFYVDGVHDTPHLAVDTKTNLFRDLVDSTRKGSVIDLIMMIHGCTFHQAVTMLDGKQIPTVHVEKPKVIDTAKKIILKTVRDFRMSGLLQYAHQRGISTNVLNRYCREIFYNFEGSDKRDCYAIGFKNDSDSWVIRTKATKMNIGCQDITTLRLHPDKDTWFIFEGFFSFLSYVEYTGKTPVANVIVLNSVANLEKAYRRFSDVSRLFWLGDNDVAGDNAFKALQSIYGGRVKDARTKFKGCNDLNDFLLKERGEIK
jgi:hypothetical protein